MIQGIDIIFGMTIIHIVMKKITFYTKPGVENGLDFGSVYEG